MEFTIELVFKGLLNALLPHLLPLLLYNLVQRYGRGHVILENIHDCFVI
jgi:hypothetical protein